MAGRGRRDGMAVRGRKGARRGGEGRGGVARPAEGWDAWERMGGLGGRGGRGALDGFVGMGERAGGSEG